nr:hypothetical protein [Tanacetum cinerariifolium]
MAYTVLNGDDEKEYCMTWLGYQFGMQPSLILIKEIVFPPSINGIGLSVDQDVGFMALIATRQTNPTRHGTADPKLCEPASIVFKWWEKKKVDPTQPDMLTNYHKHAVRIVDGKCGDVLRQIAQNATQATLCHCKSKVVADEFLMSS